MLPIYFSFTYEEYREDNEKLGLCFRCIFHLYEVYREDNEKLKELKNYVKNFHFRSQKS